MTALYQDRALADAAVEKLRAYSQPQRLMILSCLLEGERAVGEIDEVTGIGQPALSQQLAELRRAGLVQSRKEAKLVFYALADEPTALCVRAMETILGGEGDLGARLAAVLEERSPQVRIGRDETPAGAAAFARIG